MSDNVRRLRQQSSHGLTQVKSAHDIPLALMELEGECDQFLIELAEVEKLKDERLAPFVEMWRERLEIMRNRAKACQDVLQEAPALAIVG